MNSPATDAPLQLTNVRGKIAELERLIQRLDGRMGDANTRPGTLSFMKQERAALVAGIAALKLHLVEVGELPDPLEALRRLVNAMEIGAGVEDAKWDAEDCIKEWDET